MKENLSSIPHPPHPQRAFVTVSWESSSAFALTAWRAGEKHKPSWPFAAPARRTAQWVSSSPQSRVRSCHSVLTSSHLSGPAMRQSNLLNCYSNLNKLLSKTGVSETLPRDLQGQTLFIISLKHNSPFHCHSLTIVQWSFPKATWDIYISTIMLKGY